MKDNEIIELLFERSEQAVYDLSIKYGTAIRHTAENILKDPRDIDECINDTYLQVWNSIPPQRPRNLGAFCCCIARNISLNRYHFNAAEKRNGYFDAVLDELAESIPAAATVEWEYDAKELAVHINGFLERLTQQDRCLFVQRYWMGDDISGIAALLNMKEHTVSVRLFRIRQRLKKYLAEEGVIA